MYCNYPHTKKFSEIFANYTAFNAYYTAMSLPKTILISSDEAVYGLPAIYEILLGAYGDSHIRSDDENIFKLRLFTILIEAGPVYQRKMALREKLMKMTDAQLQEGDLSISNHAEHPDTTPSTSSEELLTYIDMQSTVRSKRSKPGILFENMSMIETANFTQEFIDKFKLLFAIIPYSPKFKLYEEESNGLL